MLASLRGLLDVTSQGGQFGEALPAGAEIGLVLVLGGVLFQLVVGWKRSGACCTCRGRVPLNQGKNKC